MLPCKKEMTKSLKGGKIIHAQSVRAWRNGRRDRLRIYWDSHAGSSPVARTNLTNIPDTKPGIFCFSLEIFIDRYSKKAIFAKGSQGIAVLAIFA